VPGVGTYSPNKDFPLIRQNIGGIIDKDLRILPNDSAAAEEKLKPGFHSINLKQV
jgi:hypothetical protein